MNTQKLDLWRIRVSPLRIGWRFTGKYANQVMVEGFAFTKRRAIQNARTQLSHGIFRGTGSEIAPITVVTRREARQERHKDADV